MRTPRNSTPALRMVGLLLVGLAGASYGQTTDEDAIRSMEDQERAAVLSGDVRALTGIWSERMMVNSPLGRVSVNRSETFRLMQAGVIRYRTFDRIIESMRVDHDIAVVMGAELVTPDGTAPGAGQQIRRRFTDVWQREGAGWRMIARHANNVSEPAPR